MQTPTSHHTLESILGPNLVKIVEELDAIYPAVNPTPDMTSEEIMYRSGQRSVIEWIVNRINEDK